MTYNPIEAAQQRAALQQEQYDVWVARWPNHCPDCGARGEIETGGDRVDYGSTWVTLPSDPEPCTCTERGCCPRCGEQLDYNVDRFNMWLENREPCPFCDWHHGIDPDDYRPYVDDDFPLCRINRFPRKAVYWIILA
jgi:hypothetical protein